MKHTVKYEIYTRYQSDPFGDDEELEWEETFEEEFDSLDKAEDYAINHEEGCYGQHVEVYVDNRLFREYDLEG